MSPSKIRSPDAQQHRRHVEGDLVELAGGEGLPDRRRAAGERTSAPSAASRARAYAASKPSVTKWNVVPPAITIGSCGWWVRTKTGAWYGGSSPHQPRHWPPRTPTAAHRAEHVAAQT